MDSAESIAICSAGELFGGVERHILGLLASLPGHGFKPLLVLFHDGELARQAREQGFFPIVLPARNLSFLSTSLRLSAILKQNGIRIVHVHGYKATVLSSLARLWHRFVTVKTEHGLPEPMTGTPLRKLRDRAYHALDRWSTRATVANVCYVTADLLDYHRRPHAGLHTTLVPNAVPDMESAQFARPRELQASWFNVAIVGRLDEVKGHRVALEAMSLSTLPQSVHLHVLGTGPDTSILQDMATAQKITDRVHFLGFRRDVYHFLAHCDVLLIPSLHEGLPYTLLEAMSLAKPIVATRVGGLAEILQDGVTALLVPPRDPQSIALAILRLQTSMDLRMSLGSAARLLQRETYSQDAMSSRYASVYREALAELK